VFPRIEQLVSRLSDYAWWEIAFEVAILWVIIYVVYRFIRGTRAAGALKGLLVLLIVATLLIYVLARDTFPRLEVLYDKFLSIAAIALIVTFQPELRRLLIRLGEAPFFRPSDPELPRMVDAIVDACAFASKSRFGAIIAVERNVGLRELAETGRVLDATVSTHLLNTIFWPNTPLHDMGVVIRGRRIVAAGVQFPLAHPAEMPDPHLGTRHRAAVGLARVSDALVIIVSEETGAISVAEGRALKRNLEPDDLRALLLQELQARRSDETDNAGPTSASTEEAEP
jgi:diadenylate cyclase